jgi:hypothetical protein
VKPINEYTLKECLGALWNLEMRGRLHKTLPIGEREADIACKLANRIDELTRWNNIDNSLPPKGALFEMCGVESGTYWRYYTTPTSPAVDALYVPEDK